MLQIFANNQRDEKFHGKFRENVLEFQIFENFGNREMYQFKHLFQNSYQYNTVSNRSKRGDSLVRKTNCSITIVFTFLLFILPPPSFYTAESFYLIHLLLTGFHVMGTLGFTNNQDFAHRALIDFMPLMSVYTL